MSQKQKRRSPRPSPTLEQPHDALEPGRRIAARGEYPGSQTGGQNPRSMRGARRKERRGITAPAPGHLRQRSADISGWLSSQQRGERRAQQATGLEPAGIPPRRDLQGRRGEGPQSRRDGPVLGGADAAARARRVRQGAAGRAVLERAPRDPRARAGAAGRRSGRGRDGVVVAFQQQEEDS